MTSGHNLLIAYAVTDFVACVMPGPAVMTVMSIALGSPARSIAVAMAGINVSNIIWSSTVGLGLVALVHRAPATFDLLDWAGTAYLFWLGVQTFRSRARVDIGRQKASIGPSRAFTAAVAMQLSNSKALLFFTVVLPPFIDVWRPVAMQLVTLGVYAFLAHRLGRKAVSPHAGRVIAHVSRGILVAIAAAMALSRVS